MHKFTRGQFLIELAEDHLTANVLLRETGELVEAFATTLEALTDPANSNTTPLIRAMNFCKQRAAADEAERRAGIHNRMSKESEKP